MENSNLSVKELVNTVLLECHNPQEAQKVLGLIMKQAQKLVSEAANDEENIANAQQSSANRKFG